MTLNEAIVLAPAIASEHPHPDVSSRYVYIPTQPIAQRMLDNGWELMSAQQNDKSDPFASHRLTFGMPLQTEQTRALVGEMRPTAHLINSHNRTRKLEIELGIFVCICSNQAHTSILQSTETRIHLSGLGDVDRMLDAVLNSSGTLIGTINQMRTRILTPQQQVHFARRSLMHADSRGGPDFIDVVDAERILIPQRESQRDVRDVWTTYNVIQENIIERGRRGKGVYEILRNSRLNKQLWDEAALMLN
jgi:hypothetical protein